jgi:hypothetical protein
MSLISNSTAQRCSQAAAALQPLPRHLKPELCSWLPSRTPRPTPYPRLTFTTPVVRRGVPIQAAEKEEATAQPATSAAARDDDILPDSLTDALEDSAEATALALQKGVERCIVEVLLPEFWWVFGAGKGGRGGLGRQYSINADIGSRHAAMLGAWPRPEVLYNAAAPLTHWPLPESHLTTACFLQGPRLRAGVCRGG